ncbi:FAD dependent oxidoreductase [Pseudodesulfovibrio profundus]|uniref:FAD dependent oxidoreductase n=1 Tax=Pseudodesulfovibrio profundus TaxID=57320 RepID=A0A2C8F8Z5_9BACT|nr:FAD-dependent oxidoreductase [Pseudodesulfovibrio profundus]SOB58985.1 FAD dependent oxidoreductase [Pseudodesulfovibrio profundus]
MKRYDVVIYGATAGGVIASIAAARHSLRVLLISNNNHLGGMTTSGLSASDLNLPNSIGGIAREFYHNIFMYYKSKKAWRNESRQDFFERLGNRAYGGKDDQRKMQWVFEPHVACKVFLEMLEAERVDVAFNAPITSYTQVEVKEGKINALSFPDGRRFEADVFIDTDYDGDLSFYSGIESVGGREASKEYDELLAGVFYSAIYGSGKTSISPYINTQPCPGLSTHCPPPGTASPKIQAYGFRLTLSKEKGEKVPFTKPEDYEPKLYEHLLRKIQACSHHAIDDVLCFNSLPNKKVDLNGLDFVGGNHLWVHQSFYEREVSKAEHESYTKGLLYFLSEDERLPLSMRNGMKQWGYAKDEFIDNDNFPPCLYIRASRRMLGDYILTEKNIFGLNKVNDPVAVGSYSIDSHVVDRVISSRGEVIDEGAIYIKVPPYDISYRSMLPPVDSVSNLIVAVALSASYIAYSSLRMEPTFMTIGHAAGTAAALCVSCNKNTHELDYTTLKNTLLKEGQVISIDGMS